MVAPRRNHMPTFAIVAMYMYVNVYLLNAGKKNDN